MTTYLVDTGILVEHLRDPSVARSLLRLIAHGHALGTTCVNIAEVEAGLRPRDRRSAEMLLRQLRYLDTTRVAAAIAGRYQSRAGPGLDTSDALIAGTARAHGATILTHDPSLYPAHRVRCVGLRAT
jgi:predicted nucleic acid-binding protein